MSYMKSGTQGCLRINKKKQHQRRPIALVSGLLAALFVFGGVFFLIPKHESANLTRGVLGADVPPYWAWLETEGHNRPLNDTSQPVYGYSVIPGGVRNGSELKRALARDPVAASHYSGFHAQAARPIRLDQARQVYVSYRLGSHIYWTRKKVTLHAGETLLTDGKHLVRARCGNRISEVHTDPTSSGEPPEPVLSAPVLPRTTVETVDLPPPPPIWNESPTPFLLAMAPAPEASSGGPAFLPPFPFLPGTSGGHTATSAPTPPPPPPVVPPTGPGPGPGTSSYPTPPPPVVPPVAAPEPQTFELLLIGLPGALVLLKSRRP